MVKKKGKPRFDIRKYKADLRKHYRSIRSSIDAVEKQRLNENIFRAVMNLNEFKQSAVVLCFVSTPEEIDTHLFIEACITAGKKVGVPYCIDGTRDMDFYFIGGISELKRRTFGVLEPVPETSQRCEDFSDCICIVPGLTFDDFGLRIGYGGGYYDRFLQKKYKGNLKVGVCYDQCFSKDKLIMGRYDAVCDCVVTESTVKRNQTPLKTNRSM